ncbi:MAG: triose-phosphate isomerase, partial [Oscillospiraceae bacterium]
MNSSLRTPIIAGNWKMNLNRKETAFLITDFAPNILSAKPEVIIGVPFTNLETAKNIIKPTNIKLAAQNCHFAPKGAYTGEISVSMLKEIGVDYIIIGHSERRQYFSETNQTVNLKVKAALEQGIKVILCVGETLEQREQNVTTEVISLQVIEGLKDVKAK